MTSSDGQSHDLLGRAGPPPHSLRGLVSLDAAAALHLCGIGVLMRDRVLP